MTLEQIDKELAEQYEAFNRFLKAKTSPEDPAYRQMMTRLAELRAERAKFEVPAPPRTREQVRECFTYFEANVQRYLDSPSEQDNQAGRLLAEGLAEAKRMFRLTEAERKLIE